MSKKLTIEEMHEIAEAKRGKCLSEFYTNAHTKLYWQCEKGHKWWAKPYLIKSGQWCRKCYDNRRGDSLRRGFKWFKDHAKKKGGECTSKPEDYKNPRSVLAFVCKEGHSFKARGRDVKYDKNGGTWCPRCATRRYYKEEIVRGYFEFIFGFCFLKCKPAWLRNQRGNKMELDGYCKELDLAFEYNGPQHDKPNHFFHRKDPNLFKERQRDDQRKMNLCDQKGITLIIIPSLKIDEIQEYIIKKCKELGFESYFKETKKIEALDLEILKKSKLNEIRNVLKSEGWELISKSFLGENYPLEMECNLGHRIRMRWTDFKSGVRCRKCSAKKQGIKNRISWGRIIEELDQRGWTIISKKEEYINSGTPIKVRCNKGHPLTITWDSLNAGWGCRYCSGKAKHKIQDICKFVKKEGYVCLSTEYKNAFKKLRFRCPKGHLFEMKFNNFQQGQRCPICAKEQRKKRLIELNKSRRKNSLK